MKSISFKFLLLGSILSGYGQIDANLLLGLTTATTTEMNAIISPIEGSLLYNTVTDRIYLYNISGWQETPIASDVLAMTGTTGSVFFASGSGDPTEDNSTFFWDNTNKRLGLGNNGPAHRLDVTGKIRGTSMGVGDGSVGSPSFHFDNDQDTGFFRSSADKISISAGGQEVLSLGSSGNIGVGTPTPTSQLETAGSFATAIDIVTSGITLDETNHTIICDGAFTVTLPAANTCRGRMYVIKNRNVLASIGVTPSFKTLANANGTLILPQTSIWIQSDGAEWQQIK